MFSAHRQTKYALALNLTIGSLFSIASAEVDFEKELWPVLEAKCVDCHRAPYEDNGRTKKPKAGLRLDGDWAFLVGSENGKVLEPGGSADSYLYEVVTLPEDDDMFMPPKGDAMTEPEVAMLKAWIDEGANFGTWKGSDEGRPADSGKAPGPVKIEPKVSVYDTLAKSVKPPAEENVAKVTEAGGRVTPLARGFPLVRVDFVATKETSGDEAVASLQSISTNISQLDLSNTQIGSEAFATIGKLDHLVHLDLHSTKIGDDGLQHLKDLSHLSYLNLYDTEVTDAGLKHLKSLKNLKRVYLWQSKVTKEGAERLQKALPKAQVSYK